MHFYSNQTSPPPTKQIFEMASSSNNHFATLSSLKTPSGKFILEHVSSGDKNAATGSNAIPVATGNNKYATALKSKVSTEPTLRRRPALILGTKKLPPNIRATLASRPGLSSPRKTSKPLPQVKSYVPPSKRATALKRAITSPLPKVAEAGPSNWRDQFPPLIPRQFLRSSSDQKMNSSSSKSFSHVATKGVKTGSKQSFRSKESPLPSWSETWTTPENWFSVPENEKNISPTRNLSAFRAMYPVHVAWKVVDEDDDVALGEGRRNCRDTTGKQVLKWLASLEENSIDKPKSIEFIDAYGHVDCMYELKCVVESAQSRKKKTVESVPTGISYKVKQDKGKGKAKEVCQLTIKEKQEAIEEIAKTIIVDIKGVLTFEDKPKLDYKVNQAPWSKKEVPPREGLNNWKVDLINSICAVAPQGIDEVNTPKSTKRVRSKYPQFNVQRSQSLNTLGPNASGPYKQTNPPEFFLLGKRLRRNDS